MPSTVWRRSVDGTRWLVTRGFEAIQWTCGVAAFLAMLGVAAASPGLNLLALGFLLEAQGALARGQGVAGAFAVADLAPRLGSIVVGAWVFLLPLRLLADAAADAHILHPGSASDVALHRVVGVLSSLLIVHLLVLLARGGRFSFFFRPLSNLRWFRAELRAGGLWTRSADQLAVLLGRLRLSHHFLLGLKGFVGAFAWLVIPTALFAFEHRTSGPTFLVTLMGGVMLGVVLCWVSILQGQVAREGRLAAAFELRKARALAARAPVACALGTVVTLALSLPLYIFKIVLPPRDALLLVAPLFVVMTLPGKLLMGWALGRAHRREEPAGFLWRWGARLALGPLVGLYVFILFFTQFISEHGRRVLFEHHEFLLVIGS